HTAVLVSGVWNSFIKLAMPVLALALVALQGGRTGGRVVAALVGIAGLVAALVVGGLLARRREAHRGWGPPLSASRGWCPPSWWSHCCCAATSSAPVGAAGRPGRHPAAAAGRPG